MIFGEIFYESGNIVIHVHVSLFFFIQDYLQNFWSELQPAHELYVSISQALQEKESEGKEREYSEHLPAEVLEVGIKSGRYFQVHPKSTHLISPHAIVRDTLGSILLAPAPTPSFDLWH